MSAHRQYEFPPHWDPLPHRFRRNAKPSIVDLMSIVADRENNWVRELIVEKFQREFANHTFKSRVESMENQDRLKFLGLLEQMVQRGEVLLQLRPKEPPFFPERTNSRQPDGMGVISPTINDITPDEPPRTRLEEALGEILAVTKRHPEVYHLSDEVRDKINHLIEVLQSARTSRSPPER
ncbi:hypothetical protein [Schlesneria paludicola]|uniref:hypothetical protein n=1 Tax=Schlesneria paludicola TaxID=360056 RepID=UPI00029AE001|nr:hypothetical protein [Schlesneria paludicola]